MHARTAAAQQINVYVTGKRNHKASRPVGTKFSHLCCTFNLQSATLLASIGLHLTRQHIALRAWATLPSAAQRC
eukprot:14780-Heterococcus_DN1.PRE.1